MPNTNRDQTVHLSVYGDPDKLNVDALPRPGELGKAFDANDRAYQLVQLDSGCTASNTVGVVASGHLAFWKDKDKYLVTNDHRQAIGGSTGTNAFCNQVAGWFRTAVTAGYYCAVLQRGDYINIKDDNASSVGERLTADTTASVARVTGTAVGTAPVYQEVGVARTTSSASTCYADVDIPNIP